MIRQAVTTESTLDPIKSRLGSLSGRVASQIACVGRFFRCAGGEAVSLHTTSVILRREGRREDEIQGISKVFVITRSGGISGD